MSATKKHFKKTLGKHSLWRKPWPFLAIIVLLGLLGVVAMQIPAVEIRVRNLYSSIYYRFNPPTENVFGPSQQGTLDASVLATLTIMAPTQTQVPEQTPTPEGDPAQPTAIPEPSPTLVPVPAAFTLDGMGLEYQSFNNCGPANLSMNLNSWGWPTTQAVTRAGLRTHADDRNVMLSEMRDFVMAETNMAALLRYGGTIDTVKRLLAHGYPILLERGHTDPDDGWMGHYSIVTAYDDASQTVRIPDTLLGMMNLSYDDLMLDWAHFDGIYLVVYPPEREAEVLTLLGPDADPAVNLRNALDQVTARIQELSGRELFFAWYSRGSILVEMQNYIEAALAYDQAFAVYSQLSPGERPWRITWYQVGVYPAYYYTGRYQDSLNIAMQTINNSLNKELPESWYWAGRAAAALQMTDDAISHYRKALEYHPGWALPLEGLAELGVQP
jgi:hypothetical protein